MAQADKLERLMNLLATLLETPKPLTADEVHERVPGYAGDHTAFRRAFERDKDDLREMGVPIELEEVPGSDPPILGYRVRPDRYYLPDPGLEPYELAALHLAVEAVRLDGVEGGGAFWKLGGTPPAGRGGGTVAPAALPADPNLVALFAAVSERRPVTFTYRGPRGSGRRTVDPYRLDFQRGRWYVSGFDHDRGEERNFRLDRVHGEVEAASGAGFNPPATALPGVRLAPWELGEGEPVVARVLIDADQAVMARTMVGAGIDVEELGDGSVVLALPVTSPDGFRSFVLGFLEHAEVLEPPELRHDIVDWLLGFGP
ncbi:MAG: helix-turn-helix transcriptional regulator [Acidimicrobiales bacterium]